jgi:hypothetical protein
MKHFCTLSDKNYLKQGEALIKSLERVTESYTLYYLCLDEEVYNALASYKNIVRIKLSDVEISRPPILAFKEKKPYNEYCWSLASTFCRYLLATLDIEDILYIDSDIYFYKNPQIIYDELGQKSVGIIRHRHNTSNSPDGEFNVGIVYFRNNLGGLACLEWWNDCILEELRSDLATCGDQKYLEEFVPMFGEDVCILDKTFAHGAPWNYRLYVYDNYHVDGTVVWGDKVQPLVFNHFSRFSFEHPTSGQYMDHTLGGQVFNIPAVRQMYINYTNEVLNYGSC